MERLFVDSSAWLAHVNRRDRRHGDVSPALTSFEGRLVTSNFVFDEAVTLCVARLGHRAAVALGDLLRDPGVVDLVRIESATETAAWELFLARPDEQYSEMYCLLLAMPIFIQSPSRPDLYL